MLPTPMPPSRIARRIAADAGSQNNMCWTCGSCDFECPVNVATGGRLRPQRMVRLAVLGLFDELVRAPEIWYCLQCNGCLEVCPNLVRPSEVIAYARREAMQQGVLPEAFYFQHAALQAERQRLAHQAAAGTPMGDGIRPFLDDTDTIRPSILQKGSSSSCWTCGECSSVCPAAGGRDVFDPRSIFRAAALGLSGALKASPAIWLCLSCGRCSDVCSQGIDGRQIIADLQRAAVAEGVVDGGYPYHWQRRLRVVHRCWVDAVDTLLGTHLQPTEAKAASDCPGMAACISNDPYGETIPFPKNAMGAPPEALLRHA